VERANMLCRRGGTSVVIACGLLLPACTATRQPATALPPAPASGTTQTAAQRGSASGTVTIDASSPGATISSQVRGANMALWFDITQAGIAKEFQTAKLQLTRWPGGSDSDLYHWQAHTMCNGGYANANSTFDNFVHDVVQPARLAPSITVNYGSNAACNGGGDPSEAAAWVDYANNTQHYGIKYWTVGNEVYGSWEYDLHNPPHDPTTYAAAVASGYYPQMKAKDPNAQVGVVVDGASSWDGIVLQQAKFDFVEYHLYAQAPGQESDTYLVEDAAPALAQAVSSLRTELNGYGVSAGVPIYLGELGSVYSNPGKQTSSITQALFAGQVIADLMSAGVPRATWWLGNGGCSDSSSGNFSNSLYGWQAFGGYMIFSDGLPEYGCPSAPSLPLGVPLPTARAYQVLGKFGANGQRMLAATVSSGLPLVRGYGATLSNGYSALLFNLDKSHSANVSVTISHAAGSSYAGAQTVYDKKRYDASKNNVWLGPVTKNLGTLSPTFSVTLSPWSMTVINLT
jgi:hypothetical protein